MENFPKETPEQSKQRMDKLLQSLKDYYQEFYEERAGIREYDGGYTRSLAEIYAKRDMRDEARQRGDVEEMTPEEFWQVVMG